MGQRNIEQRRNTVQQLVVSRTANPHPSGAHGVRHGVAEVGWMMGAEPHASVMLPSFPYVCESFSGASCSLLQYESGIDMLMCSRVPCLMTTCHCPTLEARSHEARNDFSPLVPRISSTTPGTERVHTTGPGVGSVILGPESLNLLPAWSERTHHLDLPDCLHPTLFWEHLITFFWDNSPLALIVMRLVRNCPPARAVRGPTHQLNSPLSTPCPLLSNSLPGFTGLGSSLS